MGIRDDPRKQKNAFFSIPRGLTVIDLVPTLRLDSCGSSPNSSFNYITKLCGDGLGCDPDPDVNPTCNNRDEGAAIVWEGGSFSSHRQFDFDNGNPSNFTAYALVLGEKLIVKGNVLRLTLSKSNSKFELSVIPVALPIALFILTF